MLRRPETTGIWHGRLPHWEVEGGRYFVTIHLRGAIPKQGVDRFEQYFQALQKRASAGSPDSGLLLMRTIFREMEAWLDHAKSNVLLANPDVAAMVCEAIDIRRATGQWEVYEYVVMPSHIHLFLSVVDNTLKRSMEEFKRWTGHQAAQILKLPEGRFWQDEWFDHWSRDDEQDERIAAYIRRNPVQAGLVSEYQQWKFGGWHN